MVRAERWVISVSVLPLVTFQPVLEPLWGRVDGGWWRMRSGARGDLAAFLRLLSEPKGAHRKKFKWLDFAYFSMGRKF